MFGNTSEFTPMIRNNTFVENLRKNQPVIYPNPIHAGERMYIGSIQNNIYSVVLIDQFGRVIFRQDHVANGFVELPEDLFTQRIYH